MLFKSVGFVLTSTAIATLVACGGGGGGGATSAAVVAAAVPTTNPKLAFSNLMVARVAADWWNTTQSNPSGYKDTVITTSSTDQLYGKTGSLIGPTTVIKLQYNHALNTTLLLSKKVWEIHLDKVTGEVVGVGEITNDLTSSAFCINRTTQSTIPTSTTNNGTGAIIDGTWNNYNSIFIAGTYADYCQGDTSNPPYPVQLRWSFETASNISYFCVNDYSIGNKLNMSICFGVDISGAITKSIRTRQYDLITGVITFEATN